MTSESSASDWLGVVLGFVAIVIGLWVAREVWRQAEKLHRENLAKDVEIYARDRYQALTDLSVEVLDDAHALATLTNLRWSELLDADLAAASRVGTEGRTAALATLVRLETRLELLVLTEHLLPQAAAAGTHVTDALRRLRDESAWLLGDATFAVITHFEDPTEHQPASWTRETLTEDLVMNSIQNVSSRLVVSLEGHREGRIPTWREPGSPWPRLYADRVAALLEDLTAEERAAMAPTDPVVAAHEQLVVSVARFRDAFIAVVDAYEATRTAA